MDQTKLIKTGTQKMTKEEWLAFRQPITHVKKFLRQHGFANMDFDIQSQKWYDKLILFFKSDKWDDFIFPCIGASEMGTVLGLNKWKSSVELFYEKVGLKNSFIGENADMFWGKILERDIAENWQYWDMDNPEIDIMIANYYAGNIQRRCRVVNFYIQNKDCPWIFVSLDRLINKNDAQKEGVLEVKTIRGYYAQQWESGTPPEYIVQVMTQIGVVELAYGELAILIDGRDMQVLPFDFTPTLFENIVAQSLVFFEKVKKAVAYEILKKICPNELMGKRYQAGIDSLSPDPDGSISYENYLKEAYVDNGLEKVGDDLDLLFAQRHERLKANHKLLVEQARLCKNHLKNSLKGYVSMNFGKLDPGRITWRRDRRGVKRFMIHIKVEQLDMQTLEEMIALAMPQRKVEHDPKFNLP